MIVRIEDIKEVCNKIYAAVDASENDLVTTVLQLKAVNNVLYLIISNKEYYVKANLNVIETPDFNATVNANLFLSLIANTTSDTVEFIINDTNLEIAGNGKYKLPLIFDGATMLNIPEIRINNVTQSFTIDSNILHSILNYNSKQLAKKAVQNPIQKLYYVDNEGCITISPTSACVNKFDLARPVHMLLTEKLAKLFKLFDDGSVNFSYGHDQISNEMVQTKACFSNSSISITAILPSDQSLVSAMPVSMVRSTAFDDYPFTIDINKTALMQTIKRQLLFQSTVAVPVIHFEFRTTEVEVSDVQHVNKEILYYKGEQEVSELYEMDLNLFSLKTLLENCVDQYMTLKFGNHRTIVAASGNIYNVLGELQ